MSLNIKVLPVPIKPTSMMLRLVVLSLLFISDLASGQATNDVDPSLSHDRNALAPVRVDGSILFYVRGVSSFPAETRAKTIAQRIQRAAANYTKPPDSVKVIEDAGRLKVYAGNEFVMNIYSADAEAEGITPSIMAEIVVEKIKGIIKQYRHERSPDVIKSNALKALVALALLIIGLVAFSWLFQKLSDFFKRRLKNRIDTLENVSYKLIQANQLTKILHVLYQTVRVLILLIITVGFVDYILGLFPWTKAASIYLLELILDPLKSIGQGFINYLPSLIFLIIIYLITQYFVRLTRLFFNSIDNGGIVIQNFDSEWAMPTFKIVKFFMIVFAVVVAFPYIPGSSSGAFQGISVFLGVLFSLGSSSFIANVVAGYSMTYRRAFKKGDRIQVNDMNGYVEEQSLMVTRLRSVKNEEIVIPNSIMLSSSLTNFSVRAKTMGLIIHTTVGIGYETPWRQVEAMLKEAADRTEGLLKDPPPFVLQKELGDFAIVYEINAYCNDVNKMYLYYNALHQNILDLFNENNIQIMTPAYEGDPATPKVVPKEQWNTPLAGEQQMH